MQTKQHHTGSATPSKGGILDKSGQLDQSISERASDALRSTRKRARVKFITYGLVKQLEALESPLCDQYRRSLSCCKVIEQHRGELTTHYCRARWCLVCNRIRMAQLVETYQPVFSTWESRFLVTLTVPNCSDRQLSPVLDEMLKAFTNAKRAIKRTLKLPFKAVRVTEVTYNNGRGDFHPHFHVIVEDQQAAEALREEWLKRWPRAARSAQDVRRWGEDERDLLEICKYTTKLVMMKNGQQPSEEALDVIFRALERRRLFQPVGFTLPKDPEDIDELQAVAVAYIRPEQNILWTWVQALHDWVNLDTGEYLTGYEPSGVDQRAARASPG